MDFVTADEKAALEKKLQDLIGKRRQITERIAEARALGDLRENAEYHAAREDQGLNEATIRALEQRLSRANVTGDSEMPADMVFVGSTVKLREIEREAEDLYRLVGEATGNFDLDYIEVTTTSPMGEALLKARVGEIIRVSLPRGEKRYVVVEIIL
jgi:transcription elongation factor GreA